MAPDISRAVTLLRPAATNKALQAALAAVLTLSKLNNDSPVDDYKRIQAAFASDLVSLHKGSVKAVLNLSALVFDDVVQNRICPGLENGEATLKPELVLTGIVTGASKYAESSKADLAMIGTFLFKSILALLELPGASKLGVILRESIALLDDAGCTANYNLLRDPTVLPASRFGKIAAGQNNYFCLQSLFEILPHVLPSSKTEAKKAAYLKSLFDGPDTRHAFTSAKRAGLRQVVMDATPENWPQIVHDILSAMAACDMDKPQPIAVRMISVNGRSLGVEGQEDILYLDADAFRVCVATTEDDVLEDLEVPYCSVQSIRFRQMKDAKMVAVAVGLNAPPALSSAPVTTSDDFMSTPTSPYKFCFRIEPDNVDRFCELLNVRELDYDDEALQPRSRSQGMSRIEPLKFTRPNSGAKALQDERRCDVDDSPPERQLARKPRYSVSQEAIAIDPPTSFDELKKRARAELSFLESSPSPLPANRRASPVPRPPLSIACTESALSAVDEAAAAAATEYFDRLHSSASPAPREPSPSPASRNPKRRVPAVAPNADKPATKGIATTRIIRVRNAGKGNAVALQPADDLEVSAPVKKRKASDRDDGDEDAPAAKRPREERPPALRAYNSQLLAPDSSPPRTTYKSAKTKRKQVVVSDDEGMHSEAVDFDTIPQVEAAPEPKRPPGGRTRATRAAAAKGKNTPAAATTAVAAPAVAPPQPARATLAAPALAEETKATKPKPKPKPKPKAKAKPKVNPVPKTKPATEVAVLDDEPPAAPRPGKTRERARKVVQDDDDAEGTVAEGKKPPQTRVAPSSTASPSMRVLCPASSPPPTSHSPVPVTDLALPRTMHPALKQATQHGGSSHDIAQLSKSAPGRPVTVTKAGGTIQDPAHTSLPAPVTNRRAKKQKPKKAPWELLDADIDDDLQPAPTNTSGAQVTRSMSPSRGPESSGTAAEPTFAAMSPPPIPHSSFSPIVQPDVGAGRRPLDLPRAPASSPLESDQADGPPVSSRRPGLPHVASASSRLAAANALDDLLDPIDKHAGVAARKESAFVANGLLAGHAGRSPSSTVQGQEKHCASLQPPLPHDTTLRPNSGSSPAPVEDTRALDLFLRPKFVGRENDRMVEPVKLQSALKSPLMVKAAQKTQKVTFALDDAPPNLLRSPLVGTPPADVVEAKHVAARRSPGVRARGHELVTQDAHLTQVLAIMNEMHQVVTARVAENFATVDRGPSEKARELLRIVLDNAVEMREESVEQFNKIIDLEEEYSLFGASHAQKLDKVVQADRALSRNIAQIIQEHDRNSLVKKMPRTLFPGPLPACFGRV